MKNILCRIILAVLMFAWAPAALGAGGPSIDDAASLPLSQPPAASPLAVQDPASLMSAGASVMNPLVMLESAGQAISRQQSPGGDKGGASGQQSGGLSTALNIMIVLTVMSLAPSILLMTTCFMRILIVLGMLKQAMGTSTVPPPQVVTALTLFMTLMAMAPTIDRINTEAVAPYRAGLIRDYDTLWEKSKQPMRDFMFDQIEASGNWSSVYMILERRGVDTSEPDKLTRESVDMMTLIPAYMLSELKVAFMMGFKVYLPFLVIDMVVSTMLVSMGMMMLPPVMVSLPFKLLLFVMVDGWALVVGGLMKSVAPHATAMAECVVPWVVT